MNLDEKLYSRQIAAYGLNAMKKLTQLNVLIYRIGGLGIEIAKDIILAGPKSITIFDDKKITIEDLGSNFYIREKDIGKRRDQICLPKLNELNDIKCEILKDENLKMHIKEYNVVVITEILELEELIKINEICRENKVGFIYCLSLGLSFYCFVDFGKHVIDNLTNKDKKKYFIKNINLGEKTKIIIDNELENFSLPKNSYIIFKEIKGIPQLLDGEKRKISLSKKNYFEIDENSSKYDKYIEGGIVEELREPIFLNYNSLRENIYNPTFCEYTLNRDININLHIAFLLIHKYFSIHKTLPDKNFNNFNELKKGIENICNSCGDMFKNFKYSENLIYSIFVNSKYEISPVCGYGGGVISQEIIKYIGIYRPINQWFYANFNNILDKSINPPHSNDKSRYSYQISIFGKKTQEKLGQLSLFLIGAGATGCELMKYFAMMGIATDKKSKLIVADNDRIEKSNLNRQFLFRKKDILKGKAECAINSIKEMNDKMNCQYFLNIVSKTTESIFNEKFFKAQDAVVMAVDNFEARNYISEQCEKYYVPYFNCGTDGPYANLEAFIPGITEPASYPTNYNKIVPSCTLKLFPSNINHCVIWAYDHFEKYFNENIKNLNILYNNTEEYFKIANKIENLGTQYNKIKKKFYFLKIYNEQNFNECIKYSVKKYLKFYKYNIELLLKLNPSDKINAKTKTKFWSGNKRLPHPLNFDINDDMCFKFIKSFSILLAKALNIITPKTSLDDYIKKFCLSMTIDPPKMKEFNNKLFYENKIIEIKGEINLFLKNKKPNIIFNPIYYDKDSTFAPQIDFITNCTNLRAKNYNIEQADSFKINVIAGKMIPAIITSTASIAGLLALQLFVICQKKDYKTFMTGCINLSNNILALAVPLERIPNNDYRNKSKILLLNYISNAYENLFFSTKKNYVIYTFITTFIIYLLYYLIYYY